MQQQGEEMLREFLKDSAFEWTANNIRKLCEFHKLATPEELFHAIGKGEITLGDNEKNILKEKSSGGWKKYIPFISNNKSNKEQTEEEPNKTGSEQKIDNKKVVTLTEDEMSRNYVIADCCKPIPGDDVLGFIDDHNRIIVHKRRCPVAAKLKSGFGNRLLAVKWEPGKSIYFPVYLYIKGIDNIGILNRVTQIISGQLNVNIHRLTIGTNDGIFEGRIEMFVHNSDDVKEIQNSLKKITEIKTVTRIDQFDAVPK